MILSILISTIPNRVDNCFIKLVKHLENQIKNLNKEGEVEIIGFYDNKNRSVGEKRNQLLLMAKGKYLVFIDDDDWVSEDYIEKILSALVQNSDTDCIVFDCITTITVNGIIQEKHYSKYSKDFTYSITDSIDANGYKQWRGKVSHTMVWKSSIAKKYTYTNKNYGEDVDWCQKANKDLKTETRIDKVLYFYNFNPSISETRG